MIENFIFVLMNFPTNNTLFKRIAILISFVIVSLILWNTYTFFQKFKQEERIKMEILASALKEFATNSDLNGNFDLPLKIIQNNNNIPMILVGEHGEISQFQNLDSVKSLDPEYLENQLTKMKAENAVIGGEGNGGIIYPELHYGRDSLVGIALFLSLLAEKKMKASELRDSYPAYTNSKNKIQLTPEINVDQILLEMAKKYANHEVDTTDGVKIYIEKEWVHLRKSNTEPIIRIYSESKSLTAANELADRIIDEINALI